MLFQNAGEETATDISVTSQALQVHGASKPLHQSLLQGGLSLGTQAV